MRNARLYPALLFFMLGASVWGQLKKQPVAKFSFNNSKDYDEVSKRKAKLKGAVFASDRFGNERHAAYVFGNEQSYINLGNYKALKLQKGSISLWVRIENESWAGRGRVVNPILLTKNNSPDSSFYEAYAIGYYPETKKVIGLCTKDSTLEISVTSVNLFSINAWHHLAITYDYNFFSFYIDGNLEQTFKKNFTTQFKTSDSVMVGSTANGKNKRFLSAGVDDIEFYDTVLSASEIKDLYNAPNPNNLKIILNRVLIVLTILAIIVLFYFLIRHQATLKLKKEKQQLQLANKLLETELRVNRALMNPHFVFNSLNALQHFILQREIPRANTYLVKFSKLIRRILESNMSNVISLEMEIELIKRYLEIEDMRFEENIVYSINVDPEIILSAIHIPVMMLQPFIENAIWHGLLKKPGEKILRVSFSEIDTTYIKCIIEDNGIGRQNTEALTLEKKSLATAFVIQRLDLLNKLHNLSCTLTFEDKPNGSGTIIKILLPILNKQSL